MSFMKPGYVTLEWLEKNILSKLRDPRSDHNRLLRGCEAAVHELKQLVPSVSEWLPKTVTRSCFRADKLMLQSLATCEFSELPRSLSMFDLVFDARLTIWTLREHERYHPPASLLEIMEESEFATVNIDNVLVSCIGQEKRHALRRASRTSTEPVPSPLPAPLSLQFETRLSYQVTYKKEKRMLQVAADYSLSYDSEDPLGTNLLLVEAKREGLLSTAASQLMVYMGEFLLKSQIDCSSFLHAKWEKASYIEPGKNRKTPIRLYMV
ncbi:MAG: hypothetical protein M1816_004912 [Peltula sp. TS41687]|nr:MAG: hypothetical protein M1816_004912 [Peltula sp. TS41687]